jgi:hypothetical protein
MNGRGWRGHLIRAGERVNELLLRRAVDGRPDDPGRWATGVGSATALAVIQMQTAGDDDQAFALRELRLLRDRVSAQHQEPRAGRAPGAQSMTQSVTTGAPACSPPR